MPAPHGPISSRGARAAAGDSAADLATRRGRAADLRGLRRAVLGSAWYDTCISLSPGVVGAVIGTLVFFQARKRQARKRLAAAIGGRDLPIGLLENGVALGGVVSIALAAVRPARGSPVGLSK